MVQQDREDAWQPRWQYYHATSQIRHIWVNALINNSLILLVKAAMLQAYLPSLWLLAINSTSNRYGIQWPMYAPWLLALALPHRLLVASQRTPVHLLLIWSWHVCGSPFGQSTMTHVSSSCYAAR